MADAAGRVAVTVAYSPRAREVVEIACAVEAGSTLLRAIGQSGLSQRCPEVDLNTLGLSVWGRRADLQQPVREGDRIELCRPLVVDPKVARRERFARQGSRGTGLFANRRSGKQSGY